MLNAANPVRTESPDLGENQVLASRMNDTVVVPALEIQDTCCEEKLGAFFWAEDGRYLRMCRKCGGEFVDKTQVRFGGSPWIAVDLDGTLACDLGNNGFNEIGRPITPMMDRVKKWVAEGRTVKIFTARAAYPSQIPLVKKWLARNGLPDLEVTNVKDMRMIELWDDRCVQVATNMGEPVVKRTGSRRERSSSRRGAAGGGLVSRLRIILAL